MTLSAELTRFLTDHATAESWGAFVSGIETPSTAANLAAAMSSKGYQVGEAEVVAALEPAKQSALADQQLHGVVGGQGTSISSEDLTAAIKGATGEVSESLKALQAPGGNGDQINIVKMFEMQMLMNHLSQLSEMSTSVVSASNSAITSMARNVKS